MQLMGKGEGGRVNFWANGIVLLKIKIEKNDTEIGKYIKDTGFLMWTKRIMNYIAVFH